LDDDFHIQIADFGSFGCYEYPFGCETSQLRGPELFGRSEDADDPSADEPTRTQMSDVYAFGCIYYEVRRINVSMPFLNCLDPL